MTQASASTEQSLKAEITLSKTRWLLDKNTVHGIHTLFLDKFIRQIISRKRSKIRIWSTNCMWGKAAYSFGILLDEHFKKNSITTISRDTFEILGTDTYPSDIFLAMAARYNNKEMQEGMQAHYMNNFFTVVRDAHTVNPEAKKFVKIKDVDVRKDFSSLGKFNLILCPSLATYFEDSLKKDVCQRFADSLEDEGVLLLNPMEKLPAGVDSLVEKQHDTTRYYEKKPRN